jgi:hypothetical protein
MRSLGLLLWVCAGTALAAEPAAELAAPVKILVAGQPINVDIGHAAPCVADFYGDGTMHLLVGQFGDGKLRIYRNEGTRTEPRFGRFVWFQEGAATGRVPSG